MLLIFDYEVNGPRFRHIGAASDAEQLGVLGGNLGRQHTARLLAIGTAANGPGRS